VRDLKIDRERLWQNLMTMAEIGATQGSGCSAMGDCKSASAASSIPRVQRRPELSRAIGQNSLQLRACFATTGAHCLTVSGRSWSVMPAEARDRGPQLAGLPKG
jgi:hypothetical protein